MRVLSGLIIFFVLSLFVLASPTFAFSVKSDPQYVVMNFSDINELDWGASQEKWTNEVKPKILAQIHEFKRVLPKGTSERKLAWSTLMEYMNFPMDEPSDKSIYSMKCEGFLR